MASLNLKPTFCVQKIDAESTVVVAAATVVLFRSYKLLYYKNRNSKTQMTVELFFKFARFFFLSIIINKLTL